MKKNSPDQKFSRKANATVAQKNKGTKMKKTAAKSLSKKAMAKIVDGVNKSKKIQ